MLAERPGRFPPSTAGGQARRRPLHPGTKELPVNPIFAPPTRRLFGRKASVLALAAVALSAPLARADNLDTSLVKHAPEVMHYLREHHCKNVGILKFRVQKGKQPTSFKVGPLNDNLPGRLEIALCLANKEQSPIGIIHDADHVALVKKLPSYTNPAGKHVLFAQKYRLAWESPPVSPDLFLTGFVTIPPDLKTATVTIEAFGPASTKPSKVVSFPVAVDRSLLVDLNESFQVSSRKLGRRTRGDIDLDEDAVEDASKKDNMQTTAVTSGGGGNLPAGSPIAKNSDEKLLDFQILYDGVPQPVTADPGSPGELHIPEPNENQAVSIAVRSVAPDRIGLVLMVNGVSTLYEEPQQDDVSKNLAWVLDPGRQYVIKGYQQDNKTFKPFRVLSSADSEAVSYCENTGLIHFHIVRSCGSDGPKQIVGHDGATKGDTPASSMNISLRGLSRSALAKGGHTRSLAALKKAYREHSHIGGPRKGRGLLVQDQTVAEGAIRNDQVQNPVHVQTIVVRYYKPKGT
jgi:hypothetical protein